MSHPPTTLQLAPGTYYLCTCGQSKNYPYCDGAHKGSEFQPQKLEVTEPQTLTWPKS